MIILCILTTLFFYILTLIISRKNLSKYFWYVQGRIYDEASEATGFKPPPPPPPPPDQPRKNCKKIELHEIK